MAERTLIIVKPDGVQRHFIGEIILRFERRGFKLVAAKFMKVSKPLAKKHYSVHKDKPFYESLIQYLSSAPVMAMVWEGDEVITTARKMIGRTFCYDARPGTIRGDLGCSNGYNLVHGSDAPASAEYEIPLFFSSEEILNYHISDEDWVKGKDD